ncbi:glycosyltransferase [Fictibacillus iocasae]|uniref:Glycosyltransferase n=1 Tax=Fictibacillus iocasae TaxID=2715437 RepID=A0ABW2NPE5_9BACL
MKTLAYYISDYGYGHASRSIALIRELLGKDKDIVVVICHSYALDFMKSSLSEHGDRVFFHYVRTDVGYVLRKDSLEVDSEELEKELRTYVMKLPALAVEEADYLRSFNVSAILSDISPVAMETAEQLGVPVIGVSNFTWYTAYQGMVSEECLTSLRHYYEKMDCFIALAGSDEHWDNQINAGFYARHVNEETVQKIKQSFNKKLIFMPIGMKIELGSINELPIWDHPQFSFVVSHNMNIEHPNVTQIQENDNEVQHYVAAADLVISKAGWGTAAEAAVAGTPLLLIERNAFTEDRNTTKALVNGGFAKSVSWEELQHIDLLQEYERFSNNRAVAPNEVSTIANTILDYIAK